MHKKEVRNHPMKSTRTTTTTATTTTAMPARVMNNGKGRQLKHQQQQQQRHYDSPSLSFPPSFPSSSLRPPVSHEEKMWSTHEEKKEDGSGRQVGGGYSKSESLGKEELLRRLNSGSRRTMTTLSRRRIVLWIISVTLSVLMAWSCVRSLGGSLSLLSSDYSPVRRRSNAGGGGSAGTLRDGRELQGGTANQTSTTTHKHNDAFTTTTTITIVQNDDLNTTTTTATTTTTTTTTTPLTGAAAAAAAAASATEALAAVTEAAGASTTPPPPPPPTATPTTDKGAATPSAFSVEKRETKGDTQEMTTTTTTNNDDKKETEPASTTSTTSTAPVAPPAGEAKDKEETALNDASMTTLSETTSDTRESSASTTTTTTTTTTLPYYALPEQMRRQNCTIAWQAQLKLQQEGWRKETLPLLTGLIVAPPHRTAKEKVYQVFFNIRSMRKARKDFLLKVVQWSCQWSAHDDDDDKNLISQVGTLVGVAPGDPDGVLVILQCPLHADNDAPREATLRRIELREPGEPQDNQPTDLVHLVAYDVQMGITCAQQEEPRLLPSSLSSPPNIAACPIVWGGDAFDATAFREWLAYHYLIGVQHFFVYIQQDWTTMKNLPSAPYITYLPLDIDGVAVKLGGGATEKNYYQPNQQTDCIYRARAHYNISWVLISDIDEYVQIMEKTPEKESAVSELANLLDPLEASARNGKYAALLLRNWFWGDKRLDPKIETNSNPPAVRKPKYVLEHVHRAPWHSRRWRTKNIVYAWNVRYYSMHLLTEGLGWNATSQQPAWFTQTNDQREYRQHIQAMDAQKLVRLGHYKQPEIGVYDYRGAQEHVDKVVEDASMRDKYLQPVQLFMDQMECYD